MWNCVFPQVYDDKKLACHYVHSREFIFDMIALIPLDLLQLKMGTHPLLRFTRFFKVSDPSDEVFYFKII